MPRVKRDVKRQSSREQGASYLEKDDDAIGYQRCSLSRLTHRHLVTEAIALSLPIVLLQSSLNVLNVPPATGMRFGLETVRWQRDRLKGRGSLRKALTIMASNDSDFKNPLLSRGWGLSMDSPETTYLCQTGLVHIERLRRTAQCAPSC